MLSQWHSCPQDILQRCFSDQPDYSDNAAAACACKPWRETFISASRASTLVHVGLRTDAGPSYLCQHTNLTSLTLVDLPVWDNAQFWLHDARDPVKHHSIPLQIWSNTLGAVSATCKQLTLDNFLPEPEHTLDWPGSVLHQTLSQLSLLQHLTFKGAAKIALETLSGLLGLQVLEVCGEWGVNTIELVGSLSTLPSCITRLQLHNCGPHDGQRFLQVEDLAHLDCLQDLELDNVDACFGRVALSRLPLLSRLVWQNMRDSVRLREDILPLTELRVLCLRDAIFHADSAVPLDVLLHHLSCLQELDILGCPSLLKITPNDCQHLQLRSFCCKAALFTNIDESSFDHFVFRAQTHDLVNKPVLRVDGSFSRFHLQDSVVPKLFYAVTHLALLEAPIWPAVFGLNGVDLPLLRILDVRFPENYKPSLLLDKDAVVLSPQLNLAELYIADSCSSSFDLAKCTSLRSIGITHRGSAKPALSLPPFLKRLCLYNILSASSDLQLDGLQDLSSIKLGGRVASTDVTRQLPSSPQSVIELDLWDGLLTNLQQLSRLTNLKKLLMPITPNEQQLQIIRQLRQLRHVEVTGRKDIPLLVA